MKLVDPIQAARQRKDAETAAAHTSSARNCPVCGEPMSSARSMGYEARFCAQHNIVLPAIPE